MVIVDAKEFFELTPGVLRAYVKPGCSQRFYGPVLPDLSEFGQSGQGCRHARWRADRCKVATVEGTAESPQLQFIVEVMS